MVNYDGSGPHSKMVSWTFVLIMPLYVNISRGENAMDMITP